MIGFIVKHRQLGVGKIESAQNRAYSVRFVSNGQLMPFGFAQIGPDGSLTREVLGLGARCRTARGDCVIERVSKRPTGPNEPFYYAVSLESGEAAVLAESEVEPILGAESADPEVRLGGLQLQPLSLFQSREQLRRVYARLLQETAGLRALLGSRVDLRPHQAFVAGTVLLEPRRRFILADEVGLGKTIEAGIVIHDLLARKPDARVLVLCPGALTQQWLCELYAKFGSQLFTLLDLHDHATIDWQKQRRVISSTALAALRVSTELEAMAWDMVVVDEAHHLLTMPGLYAHVERLSRRSPAILLLSAIPAHERSDELLRLLTLLEPERYGAADGAAQARFKTLHEQQPAIGRGLRVFERRIASLESGDVEVSDVCGIARRLLATPPLDGDSDLADRLDAIEAAARVDEESGELNSGVQAADVTPTNAASCADVPPSVNSGDSDAAVMRELPFALALDDASVIAGSTPLPSPSIARVATIDTSVPPAWQDAGRLDEAAMELDSGDSPPDTRSAVTSDSESSDAARERYEAAVAAATAAKAMLELRAAKVRQRAARALRRWSHDVADRYRLSRRILRNRRARLIEQGQIDPIERTVDLHPYAPHWLETEASDAVERLLRCASDTCNDEAGRTFLEALARVLWQAQASPAGLADLLVRLQRATPGTLNARGTDFLTIGSAVGYGDWGLYRDLLCKAVRAHLRNTELDEAVTAARAWAVAGIDAAHRFRAVSELITARAAERPKMILFAGYPGLAEQLRAHLTTRFGGDAVVSFRAEQPMDEKEACVLRFQHEPNVWLLVSDESGGEGRNFQFASALVHVDTPWHAARIEQRVGRLDRLGRERVSAEVRSHVIYNDGSVEAGLVRHLDQALGVYRRSISGLEFALRDVEQRILSNALAGGLEQLVEAVPEVLEMVEQERSRDETEAVLDEASFEASTAARFRAVTRSERTEASLEHAVYDYMRHLTQARGARRLDTAYGSGAVIRFQPEKTCFGALPVDGTGAEFLAGNFDGTFRRSVAQRAPGLRFFSVSDPLFNAIIGSLDRQATGRTFGIELQAPGRGRWVGVECRFVPRLEGAALDASAGLLNRLDALFIPKPVGILVDLYGSVLAESEADTIVALRRRSEYSTHGQTWWDLSDASGAVARALGADTWPETVTNLVKIARAEARRRIAEHLDAAISAERRRMATMIEVLTDAASRGDGDARQRAAQYGAFASSLSEWRVDLDAVGVVSVNHRLRTGCSP